ncbi:MAG: hypothetical protein ACT4N8_01120 [Sphingosinicella sp.]
MAAHNPGTKEEITPQKPFDHAFPYKDVPGVTETFADGVHLVSVNATTTTIILTVSRADAPRPAHQGSPSGEKVTAARLVLPTAAFLDLYNRMHRLVTEFQQRGAPGKGGGGTRTIQ